jgi:FdhD protein
VDKVIGRALLDGRDRADCLLLCSGRISSEIVYKTIKAGIPVVISLGTPTHHALLLARTMNITVIGSARGGRYHVYTAQRRVHL